MLTFAHDTKLRAQLSAYYNAVLVGRFGAAAAELAAANEGPVDIADRGGAMTSAAGDNFDASEQDASARDMQILSSQGSSYYETGKPQ